MKYKNRLYHHLFKNFCIRTFFVVLLILSFTFSFGQNIEPEKSCATRIGELPSIAFKSKSTKLTDDAKAVLTTVAAKIRNNPGCNVVVIGFCYASKIEQQLSWDHVNTVINYLVDKEGISAYRFIFIYGRDGGDCNSVDFNAAADGEEGGPNKTPPPPHPNLRKS